MLEKIMGTTMVGLHAGRFKDIDYEGVLGGGDERRVDIESLWSKTEDQDPDFDWLEWQRRGLEWTAARADVYVCRKHEPVRQQCTCTDLPDRPFLSVC